MKKRVLSLALALLMLVSLAPAVFSATMPFVDVRTTDWFYSDVNIAYNDSLINGKTATTFAPNDNLTYAEAVKLAACMNQKYYTGNVSLKNGSPWYQSYVDYCKMNGIISKDYAWSANATRAGYMEIFSNALPNLSEINTIADGSIPDVPAWHPQASAIYKLYRAGILQGVDAAHNCRPDSSIKRSEVAAILTRMMYVNQRQKFSMSASSLKFTKDLSTTPINKNKDEYTEFSVEFTGGKAPYTVTWYVIDTSDNTVSAYPSDDEKVSGSTYIETFWFWPTGNRKVYCKVKDSAGIEITSSTAVVNIKGAGTLKFTTDLPSSKNTSNGQYTEFSVSFTGGKAPYTVTWYNYNVDEGTTSTYGSDDSSVSGSTYTEMFWFWPTGNRKVWCTVTDADGTTITSSTCTVNVAGSSSTLKFTTDLPASKNVSNGQYTEFSVSFTGGKAPYTVTWYNNNTDDGTTSTYGSDSSSVSGSTYTEMFWFWPTGNRKVYCKVTDADGASITSNTCTVNVAGSSSSLKFTKDLLGGAMTINIDDYTEFVVEFTGGKAPYSVTWYVLNIAANKTDTYSSDESTVSGSTYHEMLWLRPQGSRKVWCVVKDANGATITSSTTTVYAY